ETKNIDLEKFWFEFSKVVKAIQNGEFCPTIVYKNDIAYEYSFIDIRQYASGYKTKKFENLSSLLNEYYNSKKTAYLISEQSNELFKTINGKIAHVEKKITLQQTDLQQCEARDAYKVNGDLITANMYKIKQGDVSAECVDYSNGEIVSVPLDIRLSPAKNAQKYYKLYTKYKNAVVALTKQIEENKSEKKYLESVFDCLARAETEREIDELKIELETGGYIKKKGKKQKSKPLPPLVFTTSGGFCVRVGKNNIQNDMLTKSADKNDIWFHVKGFSGSHTILFVEDNNNQPNDIDLTEAAQLAAYHSSARGGSKIEVDYTLIRNVKKPSGAKPGFVTYEKQHTAIVDAKKPEICFDKNIL
ncbi:MAG: NFACT RNA binding domain-containing protein, partial [Clostridia bacterium]